MIQNPKKKKKQRPQKSSLPCYKFHHIFQFTIYLKDLLEENEKTIVTESTKNNKRRTLKQAVEHHQSKQQAKRRRYTENKTRTDADESYMSRASDGEGDQSTKHHYDSGFEGVKLGHFNHDGKKTAADFLEGKVKQQQIIQDIMRKQQEVNEKRKKQLQALSKFSDQKAQLINIFEAQLLAQTEDIHFDARVAHTDQAGIVAVGDGLAKHEMAAKIITKPQFVSGSGMTSVELALVPSIMIYISGEEGGTIKVISNLKKAEGLGIVKRTKLDIVKQQKEKLLKEQQRQRDLLL